MLYRRRADGAFHSDMRALLPRANADIGAVFDDDDADWQAHRWSKHEVNRFCSMVGRVADEAILPTRGARLVMRQQAFSALFSWLGN